MQRVGGSETIQIDTRVIAASNVDLELAVAQKRFREDLLYRLNVVPIRVPPLRERASDIPLLAEHFIEKVCRREGLRPKTFSPSAMRAPDGLRMAGECPPAGTCHRDGGQLSGESRPALSRATSSCPNRRPDAAVDLREAGDIPMTSRR